MLRSILAVAAGFAAAAVLSVGTDAVLVAAGILPLLGQPLRDTGLLLLSVAYVGVYGVAGCYLAAYLAPAEAMLHALILGALSLMFNVVGMVLMWGRSPAWYSVSGVVLALPCAWIGGRLREMQLARADAAAAS
jgi:hypothetical protein